MQINIVSKVEILVRRALQSIIFPFFARRNSFIYSLTKLIVVHRPKQLLEALEVAANGGDPQEFRNTLLETLRALNEASEGVARKEKSIEAFTEEEFYTTSNEEEGYIEYRVSDRPLKETTLLLNSMILGLENMVENYDDYIDLKFEEV